MKKRFQTDSEKFDLPRVESVVYKIKNYIDEKWILRFDDDELPTKQMIDWLKHSFDVIEKSGSWVVGFSRKQLSFRTGTLCYPASGHFNETWAPDYLTIQWRLYQPTRVRYTTELHTPGFTNENWMLAPPDCAMVHFDWLLRDYDQRLAKVMSYEKQKPKSGFREVYLPEEYDDEFYGFADYETSEFQSILASLSATTKTP